MPSIIKNIFKILSVLIALCLVLSASVFAFFNYFNSPPDPPVAVHRDDLGMRIEKNQLYIEVRNGESALSVGQRLEEAGVIRSQYLWHFLSRIKNEFIKTGTYCIDLPATQLSIHSILVSGDQMLIRVTIPEGVTLKKTARVLEAAGICTEDEFLMAASSAQMRQRYGIPGQTMEGYLFPDTYLFPLAYPAELVAAAMADNFFRRLEQLCPEASAIDAKELNDRIILASIVEREYRIDAEAAVMAGVFFNRINRGMALQSCATVEYVITEILGRPHPAVLYNRDIEIQNPYNTYIWSGLPPGPISAPGAVAISAVFNPFPSDYLYFRLTDAGAGSHYFSRTFDDHIQAGALYTKGN